MDSVTIGNRTVFYRAYGRGVDPQRPPVVLVHGAGGHHLVWPPQLRRLTRTAVYALDLPGHGASPPPGCATIGAYREIVRGFVEALGLPRFVLAGHSMGAAIVLDFALNCAADQHRDKRLAGLVLIGGGARMRVSPALLEGVLTNFDATTAQIVEYSYHAATAPAQKAVYLRHLRQADPQVLHDDFVACHNFDVVDRLAALTAPALIICGEQDRMTPPERSIYLHNHLGGSELLLVKDAGHNAMIEQPQVVAAALDAFLAKPSISSPGALVQD